jgi:nucleoside-diphosphate-sugar epimerase
MTDFFNTYGPQMHSDKGQVLYNFIVQVFNKNPISIYGSGCCSETGISVDSAPD